jgi:osmotically-inducible protein OsmY
MWGYLLAALVGGAVAYFMDPDRGNRRRNMARDRAMAFARRTGRRLGTQARYTAKSAYGLAQKVAHRADEEEPAPDDVTLTNKVESELFRDPNVPKGNININVEQGAVVLRGQVENPEEIDAIVEKVQRIPGVHYVESLLHLPDTSANMS